MTIVPMAKNSALARTKLINNLVLSVDGTDSSVFCCVGCCVGSYDTLRSLINP